MKLKIAGSGGMFQIPNPFCKCPICEEARIKRGRYERLGPSLYIEDIHMLIDTPEDIAVACDRQGISKIEYLSISHKDPDHTRGMRIVEPLGYNCITDRGTPVQFIALPGPCMIHTSGGSLPDNSSQRASSCSISSTPTPSFASQVDR